MDKKKIVGITYSEAGGGRSYKYLQIAPLALIAPNRGSQRRTSSKNGIDDRNDNNLFISEVQFESVIKTLIGLHFS